MEILVDDVIKEISTEIKNLEYLRNNESDKDKKFLLGALKNLYNYNRGIIALLYCKELQNVARLSYRTKEQAILVDIPIDRSFLDQVLRGAFIIYAWMLLEYYFAEKVTDSDSMSTSSLIQNYYSLEGKPVPPIISFFRETRNTSHQNGVYNKKKPPLSCVLDGKKYSLVPGQKVDFAHYPVLLSMVKESLKVL